MNYFVRGLMCVICSFTVQHVHPVLQRCAVPLMQRTSYIATLAVVVPICRTAINHCGTDHRKNIISRHVNQRAEELNKRFPLYFELKKNEQFYNFYKRDSMKVQDYSTLQKVFDRLQGDDLAAFIYTYSEYKTLMDFIDDNIAYLRDCNRWSDSGELDANAQGIVALYHRYNMLEKFTAERLQLEQEAPLHYYLWKKNKK